MPITGPAAYPAASANPGGPGTLGRRRGLIDLLLRRSPAQPWYRARASRRLAVLAYHGIDQPGVFAAQMDRLRRTARPIGLEELHESLAGGRPLPPRAVLVTFDDGDRSLLTEGLPVLAAQRIPAVAYVIAGLLGTDRPFWWREAEHLVRAGGTARGFEPDSPAEAVRRLKRLPDPDRRRIIHELRVGASAPAPRQRQLTGRELGELRDRGVLIGNHTLDHACLDVCDEATARSEVAEAHESLRGMLGAAPDTFAYPNGNHSAVAERVLTELGYRSGFLFDHRLAARRPEHPLRISRLRVNSTTSPYRFDLILSGLHPAVHRLRGGR